MIDLDAARRFLAAEFESAGLPHAAGSILAGISPFGKGAYIAAVAAALSAQPFPGGQQSAWIHPDDARIVGVIADNIERGKLDHPGFYRNTQLGEVLRRVLSAALAARQPVGEPMDDDWHLRGYAYASKQATTCAGCGKHKHTPLRIDAMGGHVCLTCIDQKLCTLLDEFGYPTAQAVDLGTGVKAIAAERERQLHAEGFTRDSDRQYQRGELAKAATAYVQLAAMDLAAGGTRDHIAWHGPAAVWPWEPEWWKPVDARRDLVRAGALIAAQIDLIDSQAVGNG
ncbi:hypothetical protein [Stenotrophomonas lactitubi]|uniref:hypothetical protein n=1 Tax=Stenotrophomonas lactitubi TaxID=2045214 RepID=UPI0020413C9C|nr:hypothetical protein [Stenotrophomonas lactitubi]